MRERGGGERGEKARGGAEEEKVGVRGKRGWEWSYVIRS